MHNFQWMVSSIIVTRENSLLYFLIKQRWTKYQVKGVSWYFTASMARWRIKKTLLYTIIQVLSLWSWMIQIILSTFLLQLKFFLMVPGFFQCINQFLLIFTYLPNTSTAYTQNMLSSFSYQTNNFSEMHFQIICYADNLFWRHLLLTSWFWTTSYKKV